MLPRDIDATLMRHACGRFPTGVTVITALDEVGAPHGMTANSFTSVSLRPPLVLFCVDHQAAILRVFRRARVFGINILAADQQPVAEQFARRGSDRFRGLSWQASRGGAPRLEGVLGYLETDLYELVEAGDHTVFIVRVTHAVAQEGNPLVYFSGAYASLRQQ